MADHNDKVCKTLSSQLSINEINENSKLISLLGKIDDLGKHRLKKNQRTEDKKNKKILKDNKIYSKVRVNQDDEEKKTMNRVDRLEKKQILQKNILMCQLDELQKEKEYKLVRQKLRGEDAKENLARSKKNYLKKRDKLLEKHLELNQKFLQMKEDKEKSNEKKRYEANQAVQEHLKAKELHLMIVRSSDPHSVSKIIEKKY